MSGFHRIKCFQPRSISLLYVFLIVASDVYLFHSILYPIVWACPIQIQELTAQPLHHRLSSEHPSLGSWSWDLHLAATSAGPVDSQWHTERFS